MDKLKEFFGKHVEKIALLLGLLLVILAAYYYKPWDQDVKLEVGGQERAVLPHIDKCLQEIQRKKNDPHSAAEYGDVPRYQETIAHQINTPLSMDQSQEYPPQLLVFGHSRPGARIWPQKTPPPPTVLPATRVLAKADKGRAIVIFSIDQGQERRALEEQNVSEFLNGLEFQAVRIVRRDLNTREEVDVTPKGWMPSSFPRLYGPPPGWLFEPAKSTAGPTTWLESDDVSVHGQRGYRGRTSGGGNQPQAPAEEERNLEEELNSREERARQMRGGQDGDDDGTGIGTGLPPVQRPPVVAQPGQPPVPAFVPPIVSSPEYFWFVDDKVETEGRYEYMVVLTVANPIYNLSKYKDSNLMPQLITSDTSAPSNAITIESFKRWYFTGGISANEQVSCRVLVQTGAAGQLDETAIRRIVGEMTGAGTATTTPGRTPGRTGQPAPAPLPAAEGEWVQANFQVRPGEEIGDTREVTLAGGEKRTIDFSTGVVVVGIVDDMQVVETERINLGRDEQGKPVQIPITVRNVRPRLKLIVMDRKGRVSTRWVESVPTVTASTP